MNPLDPYRSMEPRQIEDQPCDGDLRFRSWSGGPRMIGRLEVYTKGLWYEVAIERYFEGAPELEARAFSAKFR